MKKFLVLFMLLTVCFFPSFPQRLEFEHISDGLPNASVTSIVRDSYGYMWFGTFNGLCRYNGYNFKNYYHDPNNVNSIPDNRIRFVFEAKDKTMIVGFRFSGVCIYNRETESFVNLRHNPDDPKSISHDYMLCIHGDSAGNVWIGTRTGLDRFDTKTQTFSHYAPPNDSNFFAAAITEDNKGNLWIYGHRHNVYKFTPATGSFETITIVPHYNFDNSSSWGSDIKYDSRGNLWVGTEGYGLFRYNPLNGKKDWFSTKNKKLKSDFIFSLMEDAEGKVWIGTDGGGVYSYDDKTDILQQFENDPTDIASLSGNGVYQIYESSPGIIWIGVYASGLNIYKKYKNKFIKYNTAGKPGRCLNNKSVLSIAESSDGKIWLGTDGGGLNLFDPKTRHFEYFTKSNSIIHSNIIKSILTDKEDNLWLGSYGSGLSYLNFKNGRVKIFRGNIHSSGKSILNDHVWAIEQSIDKKIWVGLISFGINIYDPEKEEFQYMPFDTVAFAKGVSSINTLMLDSKKRMWIGTETSGMGYMDLTTRKVVRFEYNKGRPGTINSNNIRKIFEDSEGKIWVATSQGGLNRYNEEKKQFESFTVKDGLSTNDIQDILEDDHHNLWISSDKGISLFKIKERRFINFDVEDGLQGNEFNFRSALKTKDGYMYFGGIKGFNIFHPDSIRFNSTPPVVVLTDFKIFNQSLHTGQKYNSRLYLEKAIDLTREITLTPKDYVFSVEFAALDFTSPLKNKYAYRLHGFDHQWIYVNADKKFATYTNLNPGEYTFQVIACNNDGVWNYKGTSLKIIVLPPWYMTWWFRAGVGLLLIFIVVAFYYIRLRSIRERNKFLEAEVRKRTAELKKANESLNEQKSELEYLNKTKDKFFSIIAHDLKGPVRALTSLTTLLKTESKSMVNDNQRMLTSHIDASSQKIQNLVLSLLEWARAQSKQIKIVPVPIPVLKVFKENMELLSEQALQKEIEVRISSSPEHVMYGDYNMITTVVRNILSNSIKYTRKGGMIELSSASTREGEIKISIKDNGIGMSVDILSKLFSIEKTGSVKGTDNEVGTGLGMIIAKEFVELNKGKIYAESTPGSGSTFHFILPCAEIVPA